MSWSARIENALSQQRNADKWRIRHHVRHNNVRKIAVKQQSYVHYSSNDYLGLSQHPEVIRAWQKGAECCGVGAGASTHVTGYSQYHVRLEEELADWLGYSRALLFTSGFSANQAVIHLLAEKEDRIIADKLSHASLLDAGIFSPALLRRFRHNDTQNLANLLASPCFGNTLVATEGIFSMDGDSAPLCAIAHEAHKAGAWLMVDDAHGIGIRGELGRGSCWQQRVRPDLLVVTFGKAFGVSGAALLCDEQTAEYFQQFSRHLIYSTAIPTAQCYALLESLSQIRRGDDLRDRLYDNISYFRHCARGLPWDLIESDSPIQPLIIGENHVANTLSQQLANAGLWVSAIRPPTVPSGTARLRITLTATHTRDDIDRLIGALYDIAG